MHSDITPKTAAEKETVLGYCADSFASLADYAGMVGLNVLIENQKELIIGIQPEDSAVNGNEATIDIFREMMVSLVNTGRSWNFEAPGWVAWKTTEIRLNFRSLFNKAFQDILLQKSDSEALYLIGEEVADILEEIREVIFKQKVEYGTVIN